MTRTLAARLRLYLVADPALCDDPLLPAVESALAGGVTAVQLRAKSLTDRETLDLAQELRAITRAYGALFLVNDRVDLALACGADGVHLGVDDLPIVAARALAPHLLIGYSPEHDHQMMAAAASVHYFGVGPVFGTSSKADAGAAIGLDTLRRRVHSVELPVVAIGGITAANAPSVLKTGAAGIAVVSAILRAPDPRLAAEQLATALGQVAIPPVGATHGGRPRRSTVRLQ